MTVTVPVMMTAVGIGLVASLAALLAPWVVRTLPAPEIDGGLPPGASYSELARGPRLGPAVAALSLPLAVLLVLARWEEPVTLLAGVPVVPLGVLAGWLDLRTRTLSRWLVYPALAWVVAVVGVGDLVAGDPRRTAVALGCGAGLRVVFWLSWFVLGTPGFGDVRLAAVLGVLLGQAGAHALLAGVVAMFVLGGAGMLLLSARGPYRGEDQPFGPFLLLGTWVGLVAGEPLVRWYLG